MASAMSVEIVISDIRKLQAGACVSTIFKNRDLSFGELASCIKEAAGKVVQDEIFKAGTGKGELLHGEIVVTSPGDLSAKFQLLIFVSLNRWKEGNDKALYEAVISCLKIASDKKFQSIVFPALGMGGLNYPPDVVAKSIMSAVMHFSQEFPQSSVSKVYIALLEKSQDTVRKFHDTARVYVTNLEETKYHSQGSRQNQGAGVAAALSHWMWNGKQLTMDLGNILERRPVKIVVEVI